MESRMKTRIRVAPAVDRPITIAQAASIEDVEAVRALFQEYAAWLAVDLCFQGFAAELATLPGAYAPPDGRLLLARAGGETAGCAALRRLDARSGEVKRLFVRAPFRGRGLGMRLARAIVDEARAIGYARLLLDTLPQMPQAQRLYRALGFREIAPYYANPIPGAVYMALALAD